MRINIADPDDFPKRDGAHQGWNLVLRASDFRQGPLNASSTMTTSRSESQQPQYGRKRSNTVQSVYKPPPVVVPAIPLKNGDFKVLTAWVHDTKDSPSVTLNQTWWPGVAEGDTIELSVQPPEQGPSSSVLFRVQKDEAIKHQLQVDYASPYACFAGVTCEGRCRSPGLWRTGWD